MTGWNDNAHMTTGGWIWMTLMMVLVIVAVVAFVVMLLRNMNSDRSASNGQHESAMDVLARRYAAGDIDEEEYERRRSKLLSR